MSDSVRVLCGDMREVLAELPPESVHAVVTDPPYGLEFMGKDWDQQVPGVDYWRAVLRVCKPGAHLVAFGGTRTAHRLACAIEDAGWELRDCLSWLYGSGFPKSHNLDGAWDGWGTALKPAWEPIYLARKPFKASVASNVQEHGCGALNIDGCRIGTTVETWPSSRSYRPGSFQPTHDGTDPTQSAGDAPAGRWPANLVLDDVAARALDAQTGQSASSNHVQHNSCMRKSVAKGSDTPHTSHGHVDSGGASRFFYTAKASRSEREAGLERFESRNVNDGRATSMDTAYQRGDTQRRNVHPTVKPVALMRWLVRLITPPGGLVLDPFTGSGSTGVAAVLEGARFVGCELSPEFAQLARARIAHAADEDDDQLALFERAELKPPVKVRPTQASFLWADDEVTG